MATNSCRAIVKICSELKIALSVKHIAGDKNPADQLTRVPEWVLKNVRKYLIHPKKLLAIVNRGFPMSGQSTPAEVALDVQGTRAGSCHMRSIALLSRRPVVRKITEPRVEEEACEPICSSVRGGLSLETPPRGVVRGDHLCEPNVPSSPGVSVTLVEPKTSMACNSPGRKITDLDGVGGKAKETTSARAMTRAVVSSIPAQGSLGAFSDDDALGLPLIYSAGTDRASPKKTPCLPPIRPSAIVKPFGVILLAACRANRRLARRRAVDKAKVAKVTSFGASCQFDKGLGFRVKGLGFRV